MGTTVYVLIIVIKDSAPKHFHLAIHAVVMSNVSLEHAIKVNAKHLLRHLLIKVDAVPGSMTDSVTAPEKSSIATVIMDIVEILLIIGMHRETSTNGTAMGDGNCAMASIRCVSNSDSDFFVKQVYGCAGSESGIIISHQALQS